MNIGKNSNFLGTDQGNTTIGNFSWKEESPTLIQVNVQPIIDLEAK